MGLVRHPIPNAYRPSTDIVRSTGARQVLCLVVLASHWMEVVRTREGMATFSISKRLPRGIQAKAALEGFNGLVMSDSDA